MRLLLLIIISLFLLGCEEDCPTPYREYHYAIIRQGTADDPVWMIEGLRKKGSPYVFYEHPEGRPQIIEYPLYLTEQNMDDQGVELVIIEIKILQ